MFSWREYEIRELQPVRADAEIAGHTQGRARDSVVYNQITNQICDCRPCHGLHSARSKDRRREVYGV